MFFILAFIDNIYFHATSFGLLHDLHSPGDSIGIKSCKKIAKPKSMVVCHKVARLP